MCICEIQTWKKGGRIWALDLDSYQGSAGFEAPFTPCMDVRPLSSLLYLFLSPCCVLVSDSHSVVDWMFSGEPFGTHSALALSLSLSPFLLPFFIISLFLISSTEVRSEERGILERAGIVQSLTVGVAPIVVVIASVCTFTLHMALGYDLTAAEVFVIATISSLFPLHYSTSFHFHNSF